MKNIFKFLSLIFVLVLVASAIAIFYHEAQKISSFKVNSWSQNQKADCAVALTGGVNRVREGIDVLAQGLVKKLIISGVNPKAQLTEIFPQHYYYGSLNLDDIILDKISKTTYGNAKQSLNLVENLKCRDILLITSYLHMSRSLRTFKAQYPESIEIIPRATVGKSYKPKKQALIYETFKSLFYSLWSYGEDSLFSF